MDPILLSTPAHQLRWVEAELSNNEAASDEEPYSHFVAGGLTEAQSTRALQYRGLYMGRLHPEGLTPIHMPDEAIRFNSDSGEYELNEDVSPEADP
jgi:hypothetical protein